LSLLQDLLALKQTLPESFPEDAADWEAMHAAQSDEYHSRHNHLHDQDDAHDTFHHHDESDMTTQHLAGTDEFSVEHDSDDMVHLLDGERTIRVTMPYHDWVELCKQTLRAHHE
jgi:hypothetical protein